ncbi:hypothetical protein U1Q18_017036 [Sarracenia purpurea var. burkii]
MDLDPCIYEWAESGRPKNNNLISNKDLWPKESGAHLALFTIDILEVSTKVSPLPQFETRPKEIEEKSRPREEKLPKAGRWKKLARGDKQETRLLDTVSGIKRNTENEAMKDDQASIK